MAEHTSGTGTAPPGGGPGAADSREKMKDYASSTASEARDQARSTFEQAKQQAKGAAQEAGSRAQAAIESRKSSAADSLGVVAGAFRQASHDLDDQNQRMMGQAVGWAADGLERFSQSLRERELGSLLDQAEDVARRQPALFVGGAVALGFVVSRFLKSSAERRRETRHGSDGAYGRYGSGYAPSTGYDPRTGSYAPGRGSGPYGTQGAGPSSASYGAETGSTSGYGGPPSSGYGGPPSSGYGGPPSSASPRMDPLNPPPVGGV
jgi:hypothetical protein